MEQLKLKKKDVIITNTIIFLGLAFLFLYLQYAYRHQLSPFSLIYLRKSAELFWYVAIPVSASMILIWRHHRYALEGYLFSIFLVAFKIVEGLFIEFNKIIVIALFFYTIISYFLYQLLATYFRQASVNPNYTTSDLFEPLLKKIPCKVGDQVGYLTNWDEEGCFIFLENPSAVPNQVSVTISFKNREFTQEGEVVAQTLDSKGVGIRFQKITRDLTNFNWSEFNDLVYELGFQPERLR